MMAETDSRSRSIRRLRVGGNYHWYQDWMGLYFGPDCREHPQVPPNVDAAAKTQWETDFRSFAQHCRELGLGVLRVQLLVNAVTYGTIDSGGRFVPPTAERDARLLAATRTAYARQLEVMLDACREHGIMMLPCLIGFDACKPMGSPGGGGRSALVTDRAVRERFFDDILELLLERSQPYRDVIHAWEVFSEPVWPVRRPLSILASLFRCWNMTPNIDRRCMREFLEQAICRINRAGFLATIGHNFEATYSLCGIGCGDERLLPVSGDAQYMRQFHWYPDGITRRALPAQEHTQSIIGEFSARPAARGSRNPEQWAWPELRGRDGTGVYDAVRSRLERLDDAGYELACLWPNQDHRPGSNSNLDPDAERAVVDFLVGAAGPAPA